jgi:hypothetical protein
MRVYPGEPDLGNLGFRVSLILACADEVIE